MSRIHWKMERGHLGADPEFEETRDGTLYCKISAASTERWYDKDKKEWVDGETSWIRATAWDYQAEQIEALDLQKGDPVYMEGTMKRAEWEVEEDGEVFIEEGWNFRIDKLFAHAQFDKEDLEYDKGSKSSAKPKRRRKKKSSGGSSTRKKRSSRSTKSKVKTKSGSSIADRVRKQLGK